ncbi:glycosyltransferase [Helicobacter brantae]|uniref:glycosyltransferase n=1 Tax=Helicobacter brantae TaxID=375927 RepID=UPI0011C06176|nr:glycosyltransferase [Helicobacter brantae]
MYARRTNRSGESFFRSLCGNMFYQISNFFSEVSIPNGSRDYRILSYDALEALLQMQEYHRFSKAMFEWIGFEKKCLEYEYIPRQEGQSSWNFWKLFKYAIEGFVSFSTAPLRLAFILGFLASFLSICYGGYIAIDTLIYGNEVKGYPSLVCIITFFGGLQLLVLGVIGEYIARIYEQVKNRPHYFLKRNKNEK